MSRAARKCYRLPIMIFISSEKRQQITVAISAIVEIPEVYRIVRINHSVLNYVWLIAL